MEKDRSRLILRWWVSFENFAHLRWHSDGFVSCGIILPVSRKRFVTTEFVTTENIYSRPEMSAGEISLSRRIRWLMGNSRTSTTMSYVSSRWMATNWSRVQNLIIKYRWDDIPSIALIYLFEIMSVTPNLITATLRCETRFWWLGFPLRMAS